jgi:hypothetical protein
MIALAHAPSNTARHLAAFLMLTGLVACTASEPEDGEHDAFLQDSGKGDTGGVVEGSPQAVGVLRVANETSLADLEGAVGLVRRAAENIVAYRVGDDGVERTVDDRSFTTLAELDAVPYVGAIAFAHLLTYAKAKGYVIEMPAPLACSFDCRAGDSTTRHWFDAADLGAALEYVAGELWTPDCGVNWRVDCYRDGNMVERSFCAAPPLAQVAYLYCPGYGYSTVPDQDLCNRGDLYRMDCAR